MKKTKKIAILLIIILLSTGFYNCYATGVVVTKENLNTAIQKYASPASNNENLEITVVDNTISIKSDESNYFLKYNLTQKPTFSYEIPVKEGMNYEDFKSQIDCLNFPMIGYAAVANIQGVEINDALTYFSMIYMKSVLNGSWSSGDSYVIYDDTQADDSVTIDRDENDKTILVSEFGERVMEYVNATYKDKIVIQDSQDNINSFEWIIEKKDVTETSCTIASTLSVNTDADFSKINEYVNKVEESILNKDITRENADYVIDLKVGQKCLIESSEKMKGHSLSGFGYEYNTIDENSAEIIGKSIGKANGYININGIEKSIFITIDENTENKQLETISLKIGKTSEVNKPENDNNSKEEDKKAENKENNEVLDSTTAKDNIPQTGTSVIIYIAILVGIISIIICAIKLNNYKQIK